MGVKNYIILSFGFIDYIACPVISLHCYIVWWGRRTRSPPLSKIILWSYPEGIPGPLQHRGARDLLRPKPTALLITVRLQSGKYDNEVGPSLRLYDFIPHTNKPCTVQCRFVCILNLHERHLVDNKPHTLLRLVKLKPTMIGGNPNQNAARVPLTLPLAPST